MILGHGWTAFTDDCRVAIVSVLLAFAACVGLTQHSGEWAGQLGDGVSGRCLFEGL